MKSGYLFAAVLLSCTLFTANAYEARNIIYREYVECGADTLIRPGGEWFPYPEYTDRSAWSGLFGNSGKTVIGKAEKYIDYKWQAVPATAYLAFERTGDRSSMEAPYNENRAALNALLLGELAEGKGRFTDQIMNGMWLSCFMPSWVYAAHLTNQSSHRSLPDTREQIIDLGSAGYGALMAVCYRFFRDEFMRIAPSVCHEIETAVKEKILDPYLDMSVREANWWMAMDGRPAETVFVNNWNPWCNSNVLLCFLLMEKDPGRLSEAVELSVRSVDCFLNYVKGDGACEEGTSYWEHAFGKLYDCLQILYYASGGRLSLFDRKFIRDMGEYVSRSYIGKGWVVNFADGSAKLHLDNTFAYRYGKACGSREMTDFALLSLYSPAEGRFMYPEISGGNDVFRSLESVSCLAGMKKEADMLNDRLKDTPAENVLASLRSVVPDVTWYPETEVCYIRNDDGWFLAAKAGFNNESHNHNDVGSCILYMDNVPVFVDAGVGVYTKQTFSHERYSIWTMQSDWHNLPMINGTSQIYGAEFRARNVECDPERRIFSADIAGAYSDAASCRSWVRSYMLTDNGLDIRDSYVLNKRVMPDVTAFLVQGKVYLPGDAVPGEDVTVRKGSVVIVNDGKAVEMTYPSSLTPSVETRHIDDPKLSAAWGESLRRILFSTSENAPLAGDVSYYVRRYR